MYAAYGVAKHADRGSDSGRANPNFMRRQRFWSGGESSSPPTALRHAQMPQRGASEIAGLDLIDLDAAAGRISELVDRDAEHHSSS